MRKDFRRVIDRLKQAADEVTPRDNAAGAHVLTLQAQIDAIAKGDIDAVLATAADDVTLDIFAPQEFDWIRQASGADDLRRAIQHNFDTVLEQRPEVQDVFAEGNDVVLFGRERGRMRATGAAYDVELVERFTFRDGRLSNVRIVAAHRQHAD